MRIALLINVDTASYMASKLC